LRHQGINHQSMGHSNKLVVFNLIRIRGPITRTELAQVSGLSKAAISSSVNKLLDRKLIKESKHEGYEEVGRKPHLLSINPQAGYFVSIDIGFRETFFSITNLGNQRVAKHKTDTPQNWNQILDLLIKNIKETSRWSDVPYEKIKGVSIGIPGVVNEDGVVSYVPKLGNSQKFPLKKKLSSEIELPLLLENNDNLATLGESSVQYGDYPNLVYISFHRDGIGSGIVIEGSLYRGAANHAGEIGWLVTDRNSLKGKRRDNQGFLESHITAPAITKKCRDLLEKRESDDPLLNEVKSIQEVDAKTIFRNYRTSSVANQIIQEWVKDVATSLVAVSSILDPDLIILGGEIIESAKPIFPELTELLDNHTQRTPKIEVSTNYLDNVLQGGAQICFENLDTLIWEEEAPSRRNMNF